jgi:MFS family permease
VIRALRILLGGAFARAALTNFFFFTSLNGFLLLPLYIQQRGGTEADIGLVQGMYSAAGILCQPLVGLWVDRLGRRFFMVVGAALLVGASAAFLIPGPIPLLGLLRALHGVAFSAFFVANYAYIVDLVPVERRGWALGIFGVSGLLSTALAPLVAEVVIRRLGFRWSFVLSTLLAGLALYLVLRIRELRPSLMGAGPGLEALRQGVQQLLRLHMALAFFFGLGTGTVFTFLPTFGELLGVTSLGLFYTAYAGAAMLVRVFGGELIDTRGRRAVIVPSMFVQVAATSILAAVGGLAGASARVPVLPFLFLAGLMAGGAHGFLYPALGALLMDVTPDSQRASVIGIFSAMFLVGNALGAMAFGYVVHGLGYPMMWSALTVLLAVGFLLSLRLRIGYAVRAPRRSLPPARAREEAHVDLPEPPADTASTSAGPGAKEGS